MDTPGFDVRTLIQGTALTGANEGDGILVSQTNDCGWVEMVEMTVGAGIHVYLNRFRRDKDRDSATQIKVWIPRSTTVRQVQVDRY
jgi:hypothetical protein